MRIRILEMIKTPFLAEKGEIKDVNAATAIDLEKHGMAQFIVEEEAPVSPESEDVSDTMLNEFNRKNRKSRTAR